MNLKKPVIALMLAASVAGGFAMPFGGQAYAATATNTTTATATTAAKKVIAAGMKYLGTPYEFGSSRYDTTTFDCSDFVRQAFLDGIGMKLPGDSRLQAAYVKNEGKTTRYWTRLKPGDLMFFMSYRGSSKSNYAGIDKSQQRVTHVGIYIGEGKILHTYSKASGGVKISSIDNTHWEYRFIFGGSAISFLS